MRSIKSILIGLAILLAASVLLLWNEGRTLATEQALNSGARVVTRINSATIDPQNDGKLVHLSGHTSAAGVVRDGDLGVEADGLRLGRKVEMFQWKEGRRSREARGSGNSEDDFVYSRAWSSEPIDWTKFRFPQDHRNPPMPPFASREFIADDARLGAFQIGDEIIEKLGRGQAHNVPAEAVNQAHDALGQPAQAIQGGIFAGGDPAAPRIGDVRILYSVVPQQNMSVVGRQDGDRIAAFRGPGGPEILLVRAGRHSAADMFGDAQSQNAALSWGLRFFGVVLIYIACRVILHPLRMVASYVPLLDSVAGLGAAIAALVATLVLAPVLIGLAWLFYRPLTALIFVAIGIGLAWAVVTFHKRDKARLPAAPAQ
jgi:hypothetical protein